MSDGIHNMGEFRLELFGLLALAWVIVYFCLWKGVAMTGKVVYLTATLPIFLLIAFAIRGATLPGAGEGLRYFFMPNWQKVLEPQVWVNAASQVQFLLLKSLKIHLQSLRFSTQLELHLDL